MAIRYVKFTNTDKAESHSVSSTGADYQFVAFDMVSPTGVGLGVTSTVLKWTGVGTIKAILSVIVREPESGKITPMGAVHSETHTEVKLDEASRIITIAVPAKGANIPAGSVISLLLAIGSY